MRHSPARWVGIRDQLRSYTDTARLTSLHRNTVRYRVAKTLEQADAGGRSSRMDLAVALNVCHVLGPSALRDPAGR